MEVYGGENAHFEGLGVCGDVHTCPVCSTRILEERREELKALVNWWTQQGGGVVLVTPTLRHHLGEPLAPLVDDLNDAWRRTKRGAPWSRFKSRHGIEHDVNALEILHGAHGWHPHKHVLMLLDHEPEAQEIEAIRDYLTRRFHRMAAKLGRYVSNNWGVDVRAGDGAAAYLAKGDGWGVSEELTQRNAKTSAGRTPWQLLEAYRDGDQQAGALFREYAQAIKGKRQLTYSRSLSGIRETLAEARELANMQAEARQEAEAVAPLVVLSDPQARFVIGIGKAGELLTVAGFNDAGVVRSYLRAIGVTGDIMGGDVVAQHRQEQAARRRARREYLERQRRQAQEAAGALGDRLLWRWARDQVDAGNYVEVTA
jgi:hypothetical protein